MKCRFGFLALIFALCIIFTAIPVAADENVEGTATENGTIDIYVWADNIPQGTYLGEEHVKKITVKNENIPANVISDFDEIKFNYARINLYAGEYVSADQLSEDKVSKVNEAVLKKDINTSYSKYVYVTDYIIPNTGDDLAPFLQEIIDKNPNRTIYFPDGEYIIATPLLTSAVGKKSVSIQLSDGAVIKAANNWKNRDGKAMICLGAAGPMNDIVSLGSYYVISGGTLDGNNRASAINIFSGRESVIRNICIRNAKKGIIIDKGANGNSSDCDFEDITIIGSGMPGSVGIENVAYDNTFTNIRIYDMETGAKNISGEVASIYVFNTEKSAKNIERTLGIDGSARISHCFTVNCATAFQLGWSSLVFDCGSTWSEGAPKKQTMFYIKDQRTLFSGCRAYFTGGEGVSANLFELKNGNENLTPVFEGCWVVE